MREVVKPVIDYNDHYQNCVEGKHNPLKTNLINFKPRILSAAVVYEDLAEVSKLFEALPIEVADPLRDDDLRDLYEDRMRLKSGPGREIYELLLSSAKGLCPFCSHNYPKTLDHYLPISKYPEFSIFPSNLVPSCSDCNLKKLNHLADDEVSQFLHPFFENVSNHQWLDARISFFHGTAPVFSFFVSGSVSGLNSIILSRIRFQFETLGLDDLYSLQSCTELTAIEHKLRSLFVVGGSAEVQAFLRSISISREQANKNSWQTAMYRSMSRDSNFCEMNWTL